MTSSGSKYLLRLALEPALQDVMESGEEQQPNDFFPAIIFVRDILGPGRRNKLLKFMNVILHKLYHSHHSKSPASARAKYVCFPERQCHFASPASRTPLSRTCARDETISCPMH